MSSIRITRADPAGNTTLFIEGDIPEEMFPSFGARLMNSRQFSAEQAGFILPPVSGGCGRLHMSGGEFCGNAARAFGLYLAKLNGGKAGEYPIEISGASGLVKTYAYPKTDEAYAEMPLPVSTEEITLPHPFGRCPLVKFEGIWHVIAENVPASYENFAAAKNAIYEGNSPAALGVMFMSEDVGFMTPAVYVRDSDTLFFEGSCGSGTTAAAWYYSQRTGADEMTLRQPGGTLTAKIGHSGPAITSILMGGRVSIERTAEMETDMDLSPK